MEQCQSRSAADRPRNTEDVYVLHWTRVHFALKRVNSNGQRKTMSAHSAQLIWQITCTKLSLGEGAGQVPRGASGSGERVHRLGEMTGRHRNGSSSRSALPLLPTPLFPDCLFFLSFLSLYIPGEASAVFQRFIPIMSYRVVNWQPDSSLMPEINRLFPVFKKLLLFYPYWW